MRRPEVHIPPVDLGEIVTAVNGLRPGATAEDIAAAIKATFDPERSELSPVLAQISEQLGKLEWASRAPNQVVGGGVMNLPDRLVEDNRLKVDSTRLAHARGVASELRTNLGASETFTGEWIDVGEYQSFGTFCYFVAAPTSVYVEWSVDGIAGPLSGDSQPLQVLLDPVLGIYTGFAAHNTMSQRYVRVVAVNGPTPQIADGVFVYLLNAPYTGSYLAVGATPSSVDAALLTRAVIAGRNPNGIYANEGISGTVTLSPATSVLGISGVYTSTWMDCESYPTVALLVATDQASAINGVLLQWSETAAGTDVRTTEGHSFRLGDVVDGLFLVSATRARYLRVVYTNGTIAQARFFLSLRLLSDITSREVSLTSSSHGQTGQQDVTTAASRVASNALPNRKSFRLKNLSSSARSLYYGFTGGLTTGNGDELAASEAVELDIDEFVEVYVITTSTSGAGVRCAYTEID